MAVERSEFRLIWPPTLFAAEAQALLAADADDDALGGLMAEAFHGGRGERLLQQIEPVPPGWEEDPNDLLNGYSMASRGPSATRAATRLVEGLAGDVGSLPRYRQRPLFRQRQNPDHPSVLGPVEVRDRFARVVRDLCALGYFEDAFGSECDDARDDPAACGQRVLAERLHVDVALWPLHEWRDGEVVISGVHES